MALHSKLTVLMYVALPTGSWTWQNVSFFGENATNSRKLENITVHMKGNRQAICLAFFQLYSMNKVNEGEWTTLKEDKIDREEDRGGISKMYGVCVTENERECRK